MTDKNSLAIFENFKIRRLYDEDKEIWYFSVVDIIQALIQQPDYQIARKYWNKLKERLKNEGSQSVTNCHRLKLTAADGKKYLTDVGDPETLLRLIQSVPSPNAEPIKLWRIGDEAERKFYEIEAAQQNWGVRELKRQYNSSLPSKAELKRKLLEWSNEGEK